MHGVVKRRRLVKASRKRLHRVERTARAMHEQTFARNGWPSPFTWESLPSVSRAFWREEAEWAVRAVDAADMALVAERRPAL